MQYKIKYNPETFGIIPVFARVRDNGRWADPDTGEECNYSQWADYTPPAPLSPGCEYGGYIWITEGEHATREEVVIPVTPPTPEELAEKIAGEINAKYQEINEAFKAQANSYVADYTQEDINSWFRQEREAVAIIADPTAYPAGTIASRAARRGVTPVEIATEVMKLSDQLAPAYGNIVEKRRELLDKLLLVDQNGDPETERAKLDGITWTTNAP